MADLAIVGDGITARLAAVMCKVAGVNYDLFCAPMSPVGSASSLSKFMTTPAGFLYGMLPNDLDPPPMLQECETYIGYEDVYSEKSNGGRSFGVETGWCMAFTHEELFNYCTEYLGFQNWYTLRFDKREAEEVARNHELVFWTFPHWVLTGAKPKYRHNFYTIAEMSPPVDLGDWLMRICDGRPETPNYKYTVWRGKEVLVESGRMQEGYKPLPKLCGVYDGKLTPFPPNVIPLGRVGTGDPEWLLHNTVRKVKEVLNAY